MPYKTKSGSHYHMTPGCHGALIPCSTNGLEPCSDCCGVANGATAASAPSAGAIPTDGRTDEQGAFPAETNSQPMQSAPLQGNPLPRQATEIAEAGWDGMRNGREMPAPTDGADFDRIFAEAFGQATTGDQGVVTPSERIRSLFDLDVTNPERDSSILVLADIAAGRKPRNRRETERAIADGVTMVHDLMGAIRAEKDPSRRERLLQAMGAVANDGILKGVLTSLSDFPAGWHQTHSLATACNQHDMFYVTKALTDQSKRMHMSVDEFEDSVMPMLDALGAFAESGFRRFPRIVRTVKRFPDGPDGRAWGTQESVLVTKEDVDDQHVLALMDRDEAHGTTNDASWHRGVPGYWILGTDPIAERGKYVRSVQWMVSHMREWTWRRERRAIRDYDRNVLPVLRWLARRDVTERLRNADAVEPARLV